MAIGMLKALDNVNKEVNLNLQIRIGICSGPCVAGIVVTKKKMCFDVWAPTVTFASALESSSIPGRIHTTKAIYEELKNEFEFEERGLVQVKSHGLLETYFLNQKKIHKE
jgi:class 3 adenylate cyclase